jgi:hypothetical protein
LLREKLSRINYDLPGLESQRRQMEREIPQIERSFRDIKERRN